MHNSTSSITVEFVGWSWCSLVTLAALAAVGLFLFLTRGTKRSAATVSRHTVQSSRILYSGKLITNCDLRTLATCSEPVRKRGRGREKEAEQDKTGGGEKIRKTTVLCVIRRHDIARSCILSTTIFQKIPWRQRQPDYVLSEVWSK